MPAGHSFRCKQCGHLAPSAHAGEARLPHRCPVCGGGVAFSPQGVKALRPENWEVLADATPGRLAELGLTAAEVERHTPHSREANARAGLAQIEADLKRHADRRAHWAANKDAIAAEFNSLDARYAALGEKLDAAHGDPAELARLTDERDRVHQRLKALADLEPSDRDAAHEAHLKEWEAKHEAHLAGQSAPPRALQMRARDGARARDRG